MFTSITKGKINPDICQMTVDSPTHLLIRYRISHNPVEYYAYLP